MTYEDIVAFATGNVPRTFNEYGDMIRWLDTSIPNWRLMDSDKQDEVKNTFSQLATPSPEPIQQDIEDVIRQIEDLPEVSFPEPKQKSFVVKFMNKVKNFLGRLF